MSFLSLLKNVLTVKRYTFYLLLIWFATVTVFIWLVNLNLLSYILSSPLLTSAGKAIFVIEAYFNYFRYLDNPVALSSIIFSFLVALNFTLIVFLWKQTKKRSSSLGTNAGTFVAMVGSHCISCGTSLIAPLVTAFAGSGAFFSAERAFAGQAISTVANILGIALVVWSIRTVTHRIRESGLA